MADPTVAAAEAPANEVLDLEMDLSKKKKKKKKVVAETEETNEVVNGGGASAVAGGDGVGDGLGDGLAVDLKKKKKKKKVAAEGEEAGAGGEEGAGGEKKVKFGATTTLGEDSGAAKPLAGLNDAEAPWAGSERDYTYSEMVGRLFQILRVNNPELQGVPRKFVMKPPQVVRDGKQKSVFVNFQEICKILKRDPDHVLTFLLSELGTTGSVDGAKRLIIRGRLQAKHIESMLRKYIGEYVTCQLCRSPDTRLVKENRLYFLKCESCGANRSVATVKTGYVAQVGKRKKK